MAEREWQIGIVGTFDVENYGDLLFPILAEAELRERLGAVRVHAFSYHARSAPPWPYPVRSVAELPGRMRDLDAMLIGGGYLVRFDKDVAPGYAPPTPAVHHPTGYWLTPALLALQHDVPLVWNGPGMHLNDIPAWAEPLLTLAVSLSAHVAVRDEPTRAALARFAGPASVVAIPDTAFAIARLLGGRLADECARLRAAAGVAGPYVLIHASRGLERYARLFADEADRLPFRVLAVPIGPVLGNRVEDLGADIPGLARLSSWPHPLLLAELIRESEAVIGYSYHLAITAVANGVPVFTPSPFVTGKFSALTAFDTIHAPPDGPLDRAWFLARVGGSAPSAPARAMVAPVARHWDAVAEVVRGGPTRTSAALDRYWQALPGILETTATQLERARTVADEAERARHEEVEHARRDVERLERRLRALEATLSWRVTLPLRRLRDAILGKKTGAA